MSRFARPLPGVAFALVMAAGTLVAVANGDGKAPPTTSTGRELNGPGAHHEEYIVPPSDSSHVAPPDTVREWLSQPKVRRDSADSDMSRARSGKPPQRPPTPGIDDKSSTRPGE
jgi:hypothetical protein